MSRNVYAWPISLWCQGRDEGRPSRAVARADEDDACLIRRFLATRDPRPFEILVERHKGKVHRLILAVLGPEFSGEAEELTQEVFLTAFHKLHTFQHRSGLGSWLCSIARRRAIDQKRRMRYRSPHLTEEALEQMPEQSGSADPLARVTTRESWRALEESIGQLPDPGAVVLRLHYWMGASVDEIAHSLGMAPGTVKSHLHRARHRLGALLREKGWERG